MKHRSDALSGFSTKDFLTATVTNLSRNIFNQIKLSIDVENFADLFSV